MNLSTCCCKAELQVGLTTRPVLFLELANAMTAFDLRLAGGVADPPGRNFVYGKNGAYKSLCLFSCRSWR